VNFTETTLQPCLDTKLSTAVLLIIFNRPEITAKVFNAIRSARPSRFYIAADGPRKDRLGEIQKCEEARRIATSIDWECEVHTLFREENLGCGKGPCTAITWFFEHETEGIILEDDCLPSPSFFSFCAELLERYRTDTRVMVIGGNNFEQTHLRDKEYSFRFSKHIYMWGWATWRRAWKLYDFHMNHYEEVRRRKYLDLSYNTIYERDFYQYVFGKMYKGDAQTSSRTIWDYQWQFACKINSGLTIVPNKNLVSNLGFGPDGTNTLNPKGVGHDLIRETIEFPLRYPDFMMVDQSKDDLVFRFISTTRLSRFKSHVKNLIPKYLIEKFIRLLKIFRNINGKIYKRVSIA
jgi:hypothetical protein